MEIAIIEDQTIDREYIEKTIRHCFSDYGFPIRHIASFSSGDAFFQTFRKEKYDLIFLDIYMDGLNGIDTAKKIREMDSTVKLIFITSSNDFASESYQVAASYYLRKPFSETDFRQMIARLSLVPEHKRTVALPNGQVIFLDSISHTSFSGHYATLHLISGERLPIRCSQNTLESLLLAFPNFILCTKGMIVNLQEVKKFESNLFVMKDDAYVPISRRKYPEIKQAYSNFLIDQARRRN